MVYAEEEAAGTRLLIDARTCLLQVRLQNFAVIILLVEALTRQLGCHLGVF